MMTSPVHGRIPEVSVLMACYNGDRWLAAAIESILAQTFELFELIMVDDGSKDDTWSIIQKYRDADARIVAITKENTGLADTLNVGIAQARGAWIARIDQDDLCEPMRLEMQINYVRKHTDVLLLGSGAVEIDERGKVLKRYRYPSGHHELVRHLITFRRFFPHSSAFYQRDAVRNAGGYNPRIHRAEDRRLWLELSSRGKIACLPAPLVRIRRHGEQMSLDNGGERQFCDATAATVCHLLRKHGHNDPSKDATDDEWSVFLGWVEDRMKSSGAFEKHKVWAGIRASYLAAGNRWHGVLCAFSHLIRSGHAVTLVREKCFGSALPQQLARDWILQHRNGL